MKNRKKLKGFLMVVCFLFTAPLFAQLDAEINAWRDQAVLIAQSIIGFAAVGGGLYSFFKVQTDDGGVGKKSIGNFVMALVFGAMVISVIEFFLG